MENQAEEYERSGVMDGVATVLNAGGTAMVYVYDVTVGAFGKLYSAVKKTPVVPEKAFNLVVDGFGIMKPSETKRLAEKIKEYEKKIRGLYYEIGKEGATYTGNESAMETEPVQKLLVNVREYENEIERLQTRIVEIKETKKAEALKKRRVRKAAPPAEKREKVDVAKVKKTIESAIAKAVRHGQFDTRSEAETFDKVASDLLDNEVEIKILAAAELGKIGNEAAVSILMEAAMFDIPVLTSEIINSLITLEDPKAIPLFKEKADDDNYRIRIGCLRGLYKLAEDEEAMPVLIEALRDDHQEVRRTAATFIGWKDYGDAVPALVQCLKDDDVKVRKAAVSAVANIKDESTMLPLINVLGDKDIEIREKALEAINVISGEEVTFDVKASGSALKEAINNLRDWWQEERIRKVSVPDTEATAEPEAAVMAEAAETIEDTADEVTEPEAAEEAEAVEAEPAEEAEAGAEAEAEPEPEYTEDKLMRMVKTDLLVLAQDLGIECDESMIKAEITRLILGRG